MLYKPQIGPEHRKLIDRYKKVRDNIAGISVRERTFELRQSKPPQTASRRTLAPWEEIAAAASAVLSSGAVTLDDVLKRGGNPLIVDVREAVIYVMRAELKLGGEPMSFAEIAKRLGGRNHTTVLYAWKKLDARLKTDDEARKRIEHIRTLCVSKRIGATQP